MNDEMDSLNIDNLEELRRTAISAHNVELYRRLLEHYLPLLMAELRAYRDGGVTEEILRRNDGYIKVGRGCVIALAPEAREKIEPKEPGFQGQGGLVHGNSPVTENPPGSVATLKAETSALKEKLGKRYSDSSSHFRHLLLVMDLVDKLVEEVESIERRLPPNEKGQR